MISNYLRGLQNSFVGSSAVLAKTSYNKKTYGLEFVIINHQIIHLSAYRQ